MEILGVDAGNNEVKVFGEKGAQKFLSNIGEYRERKLVQKFSDDDIVFEYNGRKGFAGTLAQFESEFCTSMVGDSKAHEEMVIRVLIALHRYSEQNSFRLIVGQPISKHTESEKQKMKSLLKGKHNITINGSEKNILIEAVEVAAEGASAYWSNSQAGKIRIMDFGSGTVNAATLVDGRYVDKDSFTIKMGLNTIDSDDFESMARMVSTRALRKWEVDDKILLVGGGASTLLPYIQEFFPNSSLLKPKVKVREGNTIKVEEINELFANAVGFFHIGKMVFKDEQL